MDNEFQKDDIVQLIETGDWSHQWIKALYIGRLFRVEKANSTYYATRMMLSPLSGDPLPNSSGLVSLDKKYFKKL